MQTEHGESKSECDPKPCCQHIIDYGAQNVHPNVRLLQETLPHPHHCHTNQRGNDREDGVADGPSYVIPVHVFPFMSPSVLKNRKAPICFTNCSGFAHFGGGISML